MKINVKLQPCTLCSNHLMWGQTKSKICLNENQSNEIELVDLIYPNDTN